jgi:hypothetical protein
MATRKKQEFIIKKLLYVLITSSSMEGGEGIFNDSAICKKKNSDAHMASLHEVL